MITLYCLTVKEMSTPIRLKVIQIHNEYFNFPLFHANYFETLNVQLCNFHISMVFNSIYVFKSKFKNLKSNIAYSKSF